MVIGTRTGGSPILVHLEAGRDAKARSGREETRRKCGKEWKLAWARRRPAPSKFFAFLRGFASLDSLFSRTPKVARHRKQPLEWSILPKPDADSVYRFHVFTDRGHELVAARESCAERASAGWDVQYDCSCQWNRLGHHARRAAVVSPPLSKI